MHQQLFKQKTLDKQVKEAPTNGALQNEIMIKKVSAIRRSLLIAIGLICVCYVICRLPLGLFSRGLPDSQDDEEFNSPLQVLLGISVILYQVQFCINIVIYAIFVENYRQAFLDIFYLITPCCTKRPQERTDEATFGMGLQEVVAIASLDDIDK